MWRQYPHRLAWAGCDRQAEKSRSACHLTVTFGMRVVLCSSIRAPSLSRWEEYGWQLGKITDTVTNATPRGNSTTASCGRTDTQGPRQARCRQLRLRHHAAYNSWVILQQKAGPDMA